MYHSQSHGSEIRFTTDGSEPSPTHGTVGMNVTVYLNTIVKAVAYTPGEGATTASTVIDPPIRPFAHSSIRPFVHSLMRSQPFTHHYLSPLHSLYIPSIFSSAILLRVPILHNVHTHHLHYQNCTLKLEQV
jgi:hypothetical protein